MTTLSEEIKEFIVMGLACFDTPTQVAGAVKERFGITVSRQQVHTYDPRASQPPAERWIELHDETRRNYLSELAAIGDPRKLVRRRILDDGERRAEASKLISFDDVFMDY
jgi:hypothetical protein